MPLTEEVFATHADGSANHDYCAFCFKDGSYTSDVTMEQMIEHCVEYLDEFNKDSGQNLTREEAMAQMREFFPTLKRWQKA